MISSSFKGTIHQTLASMPVNLIEFLVGIGYGWIAPTLLKLQEPHKVLKPTTEECSWIASLHEIARALGSPASAVLLDSIGRKYTIVISAFLALVSWLIILLRREILYVFVARVVFGVMVGVTDVSSSIYVTENCSPNIRGIVGSFIQLSFYAGVFVEYMLATYLSYNAVAAVNLAISAVSLASTYLLKETPYFLSMKGRCEAAEKNLAWLRGNVPRSEVRLELEKIETHVLEKKRETRHCLTVLFASPENYRSVLVVLVTYVLTTATGYNAINAYASIVFQPTSAFSSNEFTILLGVIQFLAIFLSPFIVERFDRRRLIIVSYLLMALCHASTSVLYYAQANVYSSVPHFSWLILASIAIYSCIFATTNAAIFMIRSELLPMSIKAIGGCLTIMANSFTGFTSVQLFMLVGDAYGVYLNFLIYFIACLAVIVHIYLFLPETRGKSLVDIQLSLKKG